MDSNFELWVLFLHFVPCLAEHECKVLISWMCRVCRKHPAGSPDHQTESASTRHGAEDFPRLAQEAYPAALVLHSGSTEVNPPGQLTLALDTRTSQTRTCSY